MSGSSVAWIVGGIIVAALIIILIFYILSFLYRRSSKDVAFVRTGFAGDPFTFALVREKKVAVT